ncbi:MAG TPA: hypothetical protein VI197_28225 [Polyangiaceae bacterium]
MAAPLNSTLDASNFWGALLAEATGAAERAGVGLARFSAQPGIVPSPITAASPPSSL